VWERQSKRVRREGEMKMGNGVMRDNGGATDHPMSYRYLMRIEY